MELEPKLILNRFEVVASQAFTHLKRFQHAAIHRNASSFTRRNLLPVVTKDLCNNVFSKVLLIDSDSVIADNDSQTKEKLCLSFAMNLVMFRETVA